MKLIFSLMAGLTIAGSVLYAQDSTTLSIGGTYSEGEYGTQETTKAYYVPLVAAYQNGMFSSSLSVPYIKLDSAGSFTWTPGGPVPISPVKPDAFSSLPADDFDPFNPPDGTTTTQTSTQTAGLGDITLKVAYTFVPVDGLFLKTSALFKAATADEKKGLGTGENDYSAQIDLYKAIDDAYIFISGGYTLTGNTDIIDYKDVGYASIALGYNLSNLYSVGVNSSYRQALFDTIDDTKSVSPYVSYKFSERFKLDFSYSYGLSNTTADNAYTITLSQKI